MTVGQTYPRKIRHRHTRVSLKPFSEIKDEIIKETKQKRRQPNVESNDYSTDLSKHKSILKKNSSVIEQFIDSSPKKISRRKRFLHRDHRRETGLSTYDRPSCGSIHILHWLHGNKIDFKDLMTNRGIAKFVLHRAIVGIQAEGKTKNNIFEADKICKDLRTLLENDETTTSDIGKRCVYIYTRRNSFCEHVNKILRGKNLTKSNHLAPYCALLSAYLQRQCLHHSSFTRLESRCTFIAGHLEYLYRGADLTEEMIEQYRQKVGQRISWPAFSSTTKNRAVAEMFAKNAVFTIDANVITAISTDYLADIQALSHFPHEEEVLLAAGINLVIGNVSKKTDGKYDILLYVSENYEEKNLRTVSEKVEDLVLRKNKKWKNTCMETRGNSVNKTFLRRLLTPVNRVSNPVDSKSKPSYLSRRRRCYN